MSKDPILEYFHACEKCEPIMCCPSTMGAEYSCGCNGLPMDFKHTEQCGDDCELKKEAISKVEG
jgi:hypothetical protein